MLWDIALELVREAERDGLSLMEVLEQFVEMGAEPKEAAAPDVGSYLYEYGSSVTDDPSGALLVFAEDELHPDEFLRRLAARELPDADLADITGQYRYIDDVPTTRIVAVAYLKPWWPRILDWDMNDDEGELAAQLEELGWSVLGLDDVYSGNLDAQEFVPYRRAPPPNARVEYHGTTYLNVISAAPELELPEPPLPFDADG